MKNLIYISFIGFILTVSCTGVKTVSKGLNNESYIEMISNSGNYSDGVEVVIDDNISFNAQVNKGISKRPKGNIYSISTGKHTITVKHNNKVIYSKQIFISSQETKQITLP